MNLGSEGGGDPRLDLTSLIDVIFILLLFFVVTTTFVRDRGLEVRLPKGSRRLAHRPAVPVVTLASDGRLALDGRDVSLEDLAGLLRPRVKQSGGVVRLQADAAAPWEKVFAVQEALVEAGVTSVSAQAQAP